MFRTDEEIIYEQIVKLGNSAPKTNPKGKLQADTNEIKALSGRIPAELYYLEETTLLQHEQKNISLRQKATICYFIL